MDFLITTYGAVAGSDDLQTGAIQLAIDACHAAGGGRVMCPSGVFHTGALVLKSFVELHVQAGCRLVASTDLDDYQELTAEGFRTDMAPEGSSKSLLRAVDAEHIAITGRGEINGSGVAFYDTKAMKNKFYAKPATARPRMLTLYRCRDVKLEDVALLESPCWTGWFMKCERMAIHRVRIDGDPKMINQDGFDIDSCRQVTVSDCTITSADDCVIVRSMVQMYDEPGVCEQVTVTNCVLNSACQGIRVGCPGDGEIRDCVFSNLVIRSRANGITSGHPHRYVPEGRTASANIHDLMFTNCTITCESTPININVADGIALKRLGDLTFSNLRIHSGKPILLQGSPETILRNIRLSQIDNSTSGEQAIICRHATGIQLNGVMLNHQTETS